MFLKIEGSYFEIEDFRSEFCLKIKRLFGPISAKKVFYKIKSVTVTTHPFEALFPPFVLEACISFGGIVGSKVPDTVQ